MYAPSLSVQTFMAIKAHSGSDSLRSPPECELYNDNQFGQGFAPLSPPPPLLCLYILLPREPSSYVSVVE